MELVLTSKGTITLPKSVLEEHQIEAGTSFRINISNGNITLIPLKRLSLKSKRNNLKKGALGELLESRKREQPL